LATSLPASDSRYGKCKCRGTEIQVPLSKEARARLKIRRRQSRASGQLQTCRLFGLSATFAIGLSLTADDGCDAIGIVAVVRMAHRASELLRLEIDKNASILEF